MRKYAADPAILSSCLKALCALMITEKVALEVGDKGGIPLIIGAMRTHYTIESLVELAIIASDSLCSVALNVPKFLAKDLSTLDLVKWTQTAYAPNRNIQDGAARIIAYVHPILPPAPAPPCPVLCFALCVSWCHQSIDCILRCDLSVCGVQRVGVGSAEGEGARGQAAGGSRFGGVRRQRV
jgi:hypothetical protein